MLDENFTFLISWFLLFLLRGQKSEVQPRKKIIGKKGRNLTTGQCPIRRPCRSTYRSNFAERWNDRNGTGDKWRVESDVCKLSVPPAVPGRRCWRLAAMMSGKACLTGGY